MPGRMSLLAPLLGLSLVVGFFLAVRAIARSGARMAAAQDARFARARPARAKVVAIERSAPQQRNGTIVMKLRLLLEGSRGRETVVGVWEVEQAVAPAMMPGASLKIRLDEGGLAYPAFAGAEHEPLHHRRWARR
jgi:hypothetical protein